MADLRISQLPVLTGALLQSTDALAVADLSASETKQITAKDLVQASVALIDAGSIPGDKVNITLPAGSVGAAELADHAVTAIKLADGSTTVIGAALPAAGSYSGQLGVVTPSNTVSVWDGSTWRPFQTGVVSVTGGTVGPITTNVTLAGNSASVLAQLDNTTGPRQFLAGPVASGGVVAHRTIESADLPHATSSAPGVAAVPVGGGLRIDGGVSGLEANLEIDNNVAASTTNHLVTYDAKGLVTGGRALQSTDLPIATAGSLGAISTGTEFSAAAGGTLKHTNQIAAGSGTKIYYDAQGHVTSSALLADTDIPNLDAAKITTGEFTTARLKDKSVTAEKLADYALAFIQEAVPTAGVGSHPIGMTWLQESTGQVSVWNGNSWMKTGASTLFNRNLRYCGTFDATKATITGVTQFGTAEGFKIGDTIPAADDKQAGVYFVCSVAGSSSSLAGGVTFDAGDWVLDQGTSGGWVRIDTLSGAGGSSTVSKIGDLLDVTLTTPAKDQMLVYTAGGQWVNKPAPGGASSTAPATPTTGQLWTDSSKSPPVVNVFDGTNWVPVGAPPADASETAKGIVELATVAEAEAGTDATRAVTPAGLKASVIKISGGASNTAPSTPATGQLWTDTSKSPPVVNVWDGTKWVGVGAVDASETVKGVVQLATTAEVKTGTDTLKVVTPKTLADNYLAKNIATLAALP